MPPWPRSTICAATACRVRKCIDNAGHQRQAIGVNLIDVGAGDLNVASDLDN